MPNPWFFLEATGEVYRHRLGRLPRADAGRPDLRRAAARVPGPRRGDERRPRERPSRSAHNDAGDRRDHAADRDRRDVPLPPAAARDRTGRFLARTELVWSRRSELAGLPQSFGAYVSAEYQFARRWFAGVRVDYADRATDPSLTDKGGSLLLTFWPSEFSQVRGQYRRTRYAEGHDGQRVPVPVPVLDWRARRARLLDGRGVEGQAIEVEARRRGRETRSDASQSVQMRADAGGGGRADGAGGGVGGRQAERHHHDRGPGVARARGRRRPDRRRVARPRLPGSALRRAEAELHPEAEQGRPADRRRPRAGDRLAAAAHHAEPQREDPAGRARAISTRR